MQNCIAFEEKLAVPSGICSLQDFRRWALSDEFPPRGRFDYLAGRIEIQWSPEDLFRHNGLKVELLTVLGRRMKIEQEGHLFIEQVRFSSPAADLSAEPDLLFVSHDALKTGRIRTVKVRSEGEIIDAEFEGAPDFVVEVVGYTSATKDMLRLPPLYWKAGVSEFWLADGQQEDVLFQIHRRGDLGFEPVSRDADGFQLSPFLQREYKLVRYRGSQGFWEFDLLEREAQR